MKPEFLLYDKTKKIVVERASIEYWKDCPLSERYSADVVIDSEGNKYLIDSSGNYFYPGNIDNYYELRFYTGIKDIKGDKIYDKDILIATENTYAVKKYIVHFGQNISAVFCVAESTYESFIKNGEPYTSNLYDAEILSKRLVEFLGLKKLNNYDSN